MNEQHGGDPQEGLSPELARRFEQTYETRVAPEVAARHRARLEQRARELGPAPAQADEAAGTTVPFPLRRRAQQVLSTAAVIAAFLLLPVTTIAVSGSAAPGDPLYDLKRQHESVRLSMAASESARAWVLLEHAERRIDELTRVGERGRWGDAMAQAEEALESLKAAEELGDPAVRAAAGRVRDRGAADVAEVASSAPERTRERLESSSRTFTGHEAETQEPGDDEPVRRRRDRALAGDEGRDRRADASERDEPANADEGSSGARGESDDTSVDEGEGPPEGSAAGDAELLDEEEESTGEPTEEPTGDRSGEPSEEPTGNGSGEPSEEPTGNGSGEPSEEPTGEASEEPAEERTDEPAATPTPSPTPTPTPTPTRTPKR